MNKKTNNYQTSYSINNTNYMGNEANYNTNHVMLTPKTKISESAVALKCISQLRRPGIFNSLACKCDQQKYVSRYIKLYKSNTNEKMKREIKVDNTACVLETPLASCEGTAKAMRINLLKGLIQKDLRIRPKQKNAN